MKSAEQLEACDVRVFILHAEGKKCARCWNYNLGVGSNPNYPTVCPRCGDVLTVLRFPPHDEHMMPTGEKIKAGWPWGAVLLEPDPKWLQ